MKNIAITIILILSQTFTIQAQFDNSNLNFETLKQHELSFNTSEIESHAAIIRKELPNDLLSWNYNNLVSLEPNSILITKGGKDTYPIWVLQYAQDFRKDVVVVCMDLIRDSDYRKQLFAKYDITPCTSDEPTEILKHLVSAKHHRTVYLSSTIDTKLREEIMEYLYPIGLPLQYSKSSFNNVAVIQNNYEDRFMLDYLNSKLYASNTSGNMVQSNLHYIPSFIMLEEHYIQQGENYKAAKINWLMRNIATDAGKIDEFDSFYKKKDGVVMYKRELPFEKLEKTMVKISDGLYAQETELSNEWYNYFLDDLLYRKEYDLVKKYGSKKTDWESFLSEEEQKLPLEKIYQRGYPSDDLLPVQNISKEAANAFCKWLSERYKVWDGNKEFNIANFHLPNQEQWQIAARGNEMVENYPWDFERDHPKKGKYNPKGPTNVNGCYLGNFYSNQEKPCAGCPAFESKLNSQDGGFFTVRVDAYWPNAIGLYNCVGNVAEMTTDAGAMGGSWRNNPNESTIHHKQDIGTGEPWIGFRIFMTINE